MNPRRRLPSPPRRQIAKELCSRNGEALKPYLDGQALMMQEQTLMLHPKASEQEIVESIRRWEKDHSQWPDHTVRNFTLYRQVYTQNPKRTVSDNILYSALRRHLVEAADPPLTVEEIANLLNKITSLDGRLLALTLEREVVQPGIEELGVRQSYSITDLAWIRAKLMLDLRRNDEGDNIDCTSLT